MWRASRLLLLRVSSRRRRGRYMAGRIAAAGSAGTPLLPSDVGVTFPKVGTVVSPLQRAPMRDTPDVEMIAPEPAAAVATKVPQDILPTPSNNLLSSTDADSPVGESVAPRTDVGSEQVESAGVPKMSKRTRRTMRMREDKARAEAIKAGEDPDDAVACVRRAFVEKGQATFEERARADELESTGVPKMSKRTRRTMRMREDKARARAGATLPTLSWLYNTIGKDGVLSQCHGDFYSITSRLSQFISESHPAAVTFFSPLLNLKNESTPFASYTSDARRQQKMTELLAEEMVRCSDDLVASFVGHYCHPLPPSVFGFLSPGMRSMVLRRHGVVATATAEEGFDDRDDSGAVDRSPAEWLINRLQFLHFDKRSPLSSASEAHFHRTFRYLPNHQTRIIPNIEPTMQFVMGHGSMLPITLITTALQVYVTMPVEAQFLQTRLRWDSGQGLRFGPFLEFLRTQMFVLDVNLADRPESDSSAGLEKGDMKMAVLKKISTVAVSHCVNSTQRSHVAVVSRARNSLLLLHIALPSSLRCGAHESSAVAATGTAQSTKLGVDHKAQMLVPMDFEWYAAYVQPALAAAIQHRTPSGADVKKKSESDDPTPDESVVVEETSLRLGWTSEFGADLGPRLLVAYLKELSSELLKIEF